MRQRRQGQAALRGASSLSASLPSPSPHATSRPPLTMLGGRRGRGRGGRGRARGSGGSRTLDGSRGSWEGPPEAAAGGRHHGMKRKFDEVSASDSLQISRQPGGSGSGRGRPSLVPLTPLQHRQLADRYNALVLLKQRLLLLVTRGVTGNPKQAAEGEGDIQSAAAMSAWPQGERCFRPGSIQHAAAEGGLASKVEEKRRGGGEVDKRRGREEGKRCGWKEEQEDDGRDEAIGDGEGKGEGQRVEGEEGEERGGEKQEAARGIQDDGSHGQRVGSMHHEDGREFLDFSRMSCSMDAKEGRLEGEMERTIHRGWIASLDEEDDSRWLEGEGDVEGGGAEVRGGRAGIRAGSSSGLGWDLEREGASAGEDLAAAAAAVGKRRITSEWQKRRLLTRSWAASGFEGHEEEGAGQRGRRRGADRGSGGAREPAAAANGHVPGGMGRGHGGRGEERGGWDGRRKGGFVSCVAEREVGGLRRVRRFGRQGRSGWSNERHRNWQSMMRGWNSLSFSYASPLAAILKSRAASWQPTWAAYTSHFAATPTAVPHELAMQKVLDVRFRSCGGASLPQLVVGCNMAPNELLLFDLKDGTSQELKGHACQIQSIDYALDGDAIVSCGGNVVKVWDASSGSLKFSLDETGMSVPASTEGAAAADEEAEQEGVAAVEASREGSQRVSESTELGREDLEAEEERRELAGRSGQSPGGSNRGAQQTATTSSVRSERVPSTTHLHDEEDSEGNGRNHIAGHRSKICAMVVNTWLPHLVATSGGVGDERMLLWDVRDEERRAVAEMVPSPSLLQQSQEQAKRAAAAAVAQGCHVESSGYGGLSAIPSMEALAFLSPSSLAAGSDASPSNPSSVLQIWDLHNTASPECTLPAHTSFISSLAASPSGLGQTLATGSGDGSVCLFDVRMARRVAEISLGRTRGAGFEVTSVGFSACGRFLSASCTANSTFVWDMRLIDLRLSHATSSAPLSASPLSSSPPFSSSSLLSFRPLHHLNQGLPMPAMLHSAQYPGVVDFGDEGVNDARWLHLSPLLVTASGNGSIAMWDVSLGRPLVWHAATHSRSINTVAISSDDKFIATGGDDQKVTLYENVQSGQPSDWKLMHPLSWP